MTTKDAKPSPAARAAGELSNAVARFLRGGLTLNELRQYMERYDAELVAMATTRT